MTEKRLISMTNIVSFFKEYISQLQKGEHSFTSGNVVCTHFDPEVQPFLLKGEVQSSMKNRVYSVEVSLDAEDGIIAASCSCPRSQLVCHHMAALCIFGHNHLRLPDMTCTSNAEENISEEDEVQSIEQIYPRKKKNYCAAKRLPTEQEIETFVNSLEEGVGFKWLLKPEPS